MGGRRGRPGECSARAMAPAHAKQRAHTPPSCVPASRRRESDESRALRPRTDARSSDRQHPPATAAAQDSSSVSRPPRTSSASMKPPGRPSCRNCRMLCALSHVCAAAASPSSSPAPTPPPLVTAWPRRGQQQRAKRHRAAQHTPRRRSTDAADAVSEGEGGREGTSAEGASCCGVAQAGGGCDGAEAARSWSVACPASSTSTDGSAPDAPTPTSSSRSDGSEGVGAHSAGTRACSRKRARRTVKATMPAHCSTRTAVVASGAPEKPHPSQRMKV